MSKHIRKPISEALWDVFYPPHLCCLYCNAETRLNDLDLCDACAQKLPLHAQYRALAHIDAASAFLYSDDVRELIHKFKYDNARYLAAFFARNMAYVLPEPAFDAIMPVPLHPARKRSRGYNQSLLLACELSVLLQIPADSRTLRRIRNTPSQTQLNADERATNLFGAFRSGPCHGKRILLVDDVLTTGHTLDFCACALYEAGAAKVYALTASS